jgi:hypothetical protein
MGSCGCLASEICFFLHKESLEVGGAFVV